MSLSQYLLGAAELAVIAAALGLGAFHARALLVPGWSGAAARLAELILGISALVVISELLGVVGLFKELPLVLACAAVGLGVGHVAHARAPSDRRPTLPPSAGPIAITVAIVTALIVVAHWTMPTQDSLETGMYFQDTTWYHMSFSGRFAQTGEIGPLHFTDPLKLAAWFYPQNSELLHGVGLLSFGNDFLSLFINLGWATLALLAAWCIGRPYALGAGTLLAAAVVLDSEMILGSQAGNAPNDVAGLFFLLAVIAFLVTGWSESRSGESELRGGGANAGTGAAPGAPGGIGASSGALAGIGAAPLALAGLAAGLGIGTKITLLSVVGALTLGLIVLAGRRQAVRAMAIWLGAMVVTAGFWYGRSIFFTGSPFPQLDKLGPLDLPGPDQVPVLYPREPHSLSEYYNDPNVWSDTLFPVLGDRLGPLWPALLGAVVLGLVWALLRGGDRLLRVLAVTGIVAGVAYVFTPLTASGSLGDPSGFDANLRYMSPPVIIGLVLLPLVPALRRGPWPWVVCAALGVLLAQGMITSPNWDSGHLVGAVILALALVAAPVALSRGSRNGPLVPAIAAAAIFAALVAIGRGEQQDYLGDRYRTATAPPLEGGFRSTPEWQTLQQWGTEARGQRIAVVGRASAFGQYVFYGDDLSNHVQYIGNELRRGTFRLIGEDCGRFRRTVNEGDYDYLVTTPRFREDQGTPIENLWTGADPASTTIIRAGPARVFKLSGKLDPAGCAGLASE